MRYHVIPINDLREQHPRLHVWIDRLFWWDKDHCRECFEIEMRRDQMPEVYRGSTPQPAVGHNTGSQRARQPPVGRWHFTLNQTTITL